MNLNHLKIIYIFFWVLIFTILFSECFIVIKRIIDNKEAKSYRTSSIFARELIDEGSLSSLWEKPYEKYKSFQRYGFQHNNLTYEIKTNGFGFRSSEFSLEKQENVIRIICIGASTTVQGRLNSLTYPSLLEKKLKLEFPNKKIEVLNFGISGTLSNHWLKKSDQFFRFNPDIVIQYNAVNDIVHSYCKILGKKYKFRKFLNKFHIFHYFFDNSKYFYSYFNYTYNSFKKMNDECNKRNIFYLVGSFAYPNYSKSDLLFKKKLNFEIEILCKSFNLKYYNEYENIMSEYNRSFIDFMKNYSIPYILIHDRFNDPSLFTDICHMTEDGINLLSDFFYVKIIDYISANIKENTTHFKNNVKG